MKANNCKLVWTSEDAVKVSGILDEYSDFSSFAKRSFQNLTVDLAEVNRINSAGIRSWIQTITRYKIDLKLIHCSFVVVDHFSMIPEFMGKNADVQSFYARYLCSSCHFQTHQLFYVGIDIDLDHPELAQQLGEPCPECGDVVELDHNPDIYLCFIKSLKRNSSQRVA